jgi:hypothetical protein
MLAANIFLVGPSPDNEAEQDGAKTEAGRDNE